MNGGDNREEEVVVDCRKAQEAALFFCISDLSPPSTCHMINVDFVIFVVPFPPPSSL
jgi:hypothetical protein